MLYLQAELRLRAGLKARGWQLQHMSMAKTRYCIMWGDWDLTLVLYESVVQKHEIHTYSILI